MKNLILKKFKINYNLNNQTIKSKLIFVSLAFLMTVIILSGLMLYSGYQNSFNLKLVYESNVQSFIQLQKIEYTLQETRYKVAAVSLDILRPEDAEKTLKVEEQNISSSWEKIKAVGNYNNDEEKKLISELDEGFPVIKIIFDKISKAYQDGDKEKLGFILETEWKKLNARYLLKLNKLLLLKEQTSKEIYENSLKNSINLTWISMILVISLIIVTYLIMQLIFSSLNKSINYAVKIAEESSKGNFNTIIDNKNNNNDELGRLLNSLLKMQKSLKEIIEKVSNSVDKVNNSSLLINEENNSLAARTEEQAASLEETAASMEELTSTVKQNAENTAAASKIADQACQVASQGGDVVNQAVKVMDKISTSSNKINDISGIIDSIAFQTNILALNAAVEAARAGEQGRGFAVVASEVRSLAQRSALAAKEIKSLIENSVSEINSGSSLVNQAGENMVKVVENVQKVNNIISQITSASHEQSNGIEQINKTIVQLEQVTQQNSGLVNKINQVSEDLKNQAQDLAKAVAIFKYEQPGYPAKEIIIKKEEEPKHKNEKIEIKSIKKPEEKNNQEFSKNNPETGWEEF